MNFISLFSGIGGFDLGMERAGMQPVVQVEIDGRCQDVLTRHWPDVRRFSDVREFGRKSVAGAVELVCGGFPCQDVSVAGKRAGLAGERSGLWFQFARIIDEFEPGWVVAENVPGLLSSCGCATCGALRRLLRIHTYLRRKRQIHQSCPVCHAAGRLLASHRGRDFAIIIRWLAERGYGVAWRIFDAQYDGLAQRRRRVFIVASLGTGRAAEILFEREGMSGNPPARGAQEQETSADAGKHLETGWDYQRSRIHDARGIAPTVGQADGKGGQRTPVICVAHGQANAEVLEEQSPTLSLQHEQPILAYAITENGRQEVRLTEYNNALSRGGGKPGTGYPAVAFTERTRTDGRNFEAQEELAYALTNPGGGGPAQERNVAGGFGVRRLTPVECERLQGFPDGWTDGQADSTRYRQLGNAVAVPVVEWIARRIYQAQA